MKSLADLFAIVNRRLSNIVRYNNTQRIHQETVAEHSYFVAFYTMVLSSYLPNINVQRAVGISLVHDVEESISGDLPHDIKMRHPEFNEYFEKMNMSIAGEIFKDNRYCYELWLEGREGKTIESKLSHFADLLSALIYEHNEELLGNTFMRKIRQSQVDLINEFMDKNQEFRVFDSLVSGILIP